MGQMSSIMSDFDRIPADDDLQAEALAWLRRLTSGQATKADAEALDRWRSGNPARARAFAEAALLWNTMEEAARTALDRNPNLASVRARPIAPTALGRRTFIAGGAALAASLAGIAVVRPPFDLWPSLSEFHADYRTSTGEQRQIKLAQSVSVEMNTRTSLRRIADQNAEIELISGEAAIAKKNNIAGELVVRAGDAVARVTEASFNIRKDGRVVCVTCIEGAVRVEAGADTVSLRDGQQVSQDDSGLGPIAAVNPEIALAWRRGLLIFQDVPLASLVEEVNRYRAGRIVLIDARLGERRVVASFRLDRIDAVIDFVTGAMHVPARRLPGGIVLLG